MSLGRDTIPTRFELELSLDSLRTVESVLSDERIDIDGYIALARNRQDRITEDVEQSLLDDISVAAIHGDELALVLEWMIIKGDVEVIKDETPSEAILAWAKILDIRRKFEDPVSAGNTPLMLDTFQSIGAN